MMDFTFEAFRCRASTLDSKSPSLGSQRNEVKGLGA